jgi:hypothetical protein
MSTKARGLPNFFPFARALRKPALILSWISITVPATIKHEKWTEAVSFCSNNLRLFSREAISHVIRTVPAKAHSP